jgi:hypothetical protein
MITFCAKVYFSHLILKKIHYWLAPIITGLMYVSFFVAMCSDPGKVTKQNTYYWQQQFPYDGILYSPDDQCDLCQIERPARAYHCTICQCCIAKRDHHCMFFNYDFFWMFLFCLFGNGLFNDDVKTL